MLQKSELERLFNQLNGELFKASVKGEVCIYGGAAMCLLFNARPSTKDIDAVMEPVSTLRGAIKAVAVSNEIDENWLNDAVKGFVVKHPRQILYDMSNLKVYVPEPDYLLAMKTLSARVDATDRDDIKLLISSLKIDRPAQVFDILEKYYPRHRVKPATQYFIEELFE